MKNSSLLLSNLNNNFKIEKRNGHHVPVIRPDKLKVFIRDSDPDIINNVKLFAKDKKTVLLITGLYNGFIISDNYNKKHGNININFTKQFIKHLNNFQININEIKFLKKGGDSRQN